MATAERIADRMIASGHSDNATIAQWKEGLKETWQDLLELIETRTQMLAASRELHKYFHDCKDALQRVSEKARGVSDELGRDAISVGALQRKHHNFTQDLGTLQQQVEAVGAECARLGAAYAGDKAAEISRRAAEVGSAWAALQAACAARRARLEDADRLQQFLGRVRTLALWMDDVVRQMNTGEKPRDVSGVELLMNNHQSLKAEIDAREDSFSACIALGRELLARQHYASADIKEKLLQLTDQRTALLRRWEERWENLQLSQYRAERPPAPAAPPAHLPPFRSPGGVPVRARRGGGGGLAHRAGALPDVAGAGPHHRRGGEPHQEARGLREVRRRAGGPLQRAAEAYHREYGVYCCVQFVRKGVTGLRARIL